MHSCISKSPTRLPLRTLSLSTFIFNLFVLTYILLSPSTSFHLLDKLYIHFLSDNSFLFYTHAFQINHPIKISKYHPKNKFHLKSTISLASSPMSDFQRRMLDRLKKEDARERRERKGFFGDKKNYTESSNVNGTPLNFHIIHTLEQFKRIIVHNYKDKIIVVRFFAPWCKACKAIAPLFHRLAILYPNIEFVDIPVSPENANLHQGFRIQTLPFGHIYFPHAGLVEEMSISRKYFNKFARILQTYAEGQCTLPDNDHGDMTQNPFLPTLGETDA